MLDLRALAFIDYCGVHAIINAGIRARRAGRRLVLVPANVDRMLALTGSSDQVEIGDVDSVAPPVHAVQRSLVARSLLMADKVPRNREPVRRGLRLSNQTAVEVARAPRATWSVGTSRPSHQRFRFATSAATADPFDRPRSMQRPQSFPYSVDQLELCYFDSHKRFTDNPAELTKFSRETSKDVIDGRTHQ